MTDVLYNKAIDYIEGEEESICMIKNCRKAIFLTGKILIGIDIRTLIGNELYEGAPSLESVRTKKSVTGLVKTRKGNEIINRSLPFPAQFDGFTSFVVHNDYKPGMLRR